MRVRVLSTALIGVAVFTVTALGQAGTALAQGQAYPSKSIHIVVAFPAGGGTDFLARQLAIRLQAGMQQSVIVDNRPGGNTIISAEVVAKAPPDGYTLFMATDTTMSLNPLVLSNLPYDPEVSFAPISHVASQPFFLVAGPRARFRTFSELLAYAKANPGKVSYGTGSWVAVLMAEKIKLDAKVDMLHVPFKGLMLPALLSGDIDLGIVLVVPYDKQVSAGKLVGLVTTGPKRESTLPGTPTVRELGYPELEYEVWTGLFAPAGTPSAVIEKLNAEVRKAWSDPTVTEQLLAAGIHPSPSSPQQLRTVMRSERERWGKVIQASGVKLAN